MKRIANGTARTVGVVSLLVLGGFGTMYAAGGHTARVNKDLTATSVAPDAHGKARLTLRGSKNGKLSVLAKHLQGGQQFDVIVGGVKVAALQTNAGGSGKVRFSTRPGTKDVLLGFDPRGSRVIVRNQAGDDVLEGDMPNGDPTTTACCIGGDGESECEQMTPEECTAQGGTPIGVPGGTAAACLPNPCATTPPPNPVICCTNATHDDQSEAECQDVATPADCADHGGMVVQATSCDPNPCSATPPTNQTACCVANGNDGEPAETECEVLSAEACAAANGNAVSSATCDGDPCHTGGVGNEGDGANNDGDHGTGAPGDGSKGD